MDGPRTQLKGFNRLKPALLTVVPAPPISNGPRLKILSSGFLSPSG